MGFILVSIFRVAGLEVTLRRRKLFKIKATTSFEENFSYVMIFTEKRRDNKCQIITG